MTPIRIKLDVTKLDKARFFRAQSGAIYCDLVAFPRREVGRYGDTHVLKQSRQPSETVELPIVGSLVLPPPEGQDNYRPPTRQAPRTASAPPSFEVDGDTAPPPGCSF